MIFFSVFRLAWVNKDFAHFLLFPLTEVNFFSSSRKFPERTFEIIWLTWLLTANQPITIVITRLQLAAMAFFFFRETFSDLKPSGLSVSLVLWQQWTQKRPTQRRKEHRFDLMWLISKEKGTFSASGDFFFFPPSPCKRKLQEILRPGLVFYSSSSCLIQSRHWIEVKSTWGQWQ